MKILAWGAAVSAMAALVACGGGNSGGGGGGGGVGGSGTTTTVSSSSSSSTTSSSSSSGTGGAAPTCGIFWEDPADTARAACETCMEDSCCSEMSACGPGTDCDALLACASACPDTDPTCVDTCITNHSQGYDDYNALQGCYRGTSSSAGCKYTDCVYPVCDTPATKPDQTCAECLGTKGTCCGDYTACVNDQTCVDCYNDPTIAGCDTNALYQAVATCEGTTCGESCTFDICGSGLGYSIASCNYCLTQQCCTQFDACQGDAACTACLGAPTGAGCDTNTAFIAFTQCRDVTCKAGCGG